MRKAGKAEQTDRQASVENKYTDKRQRPEGGGREESGAVLEGDEALGADITWAVFVGSDGIFKTLEGGNNVNVRRQAK